jgi:hypothetical protein
MGQTAITSINPNGPIYEDNQGGMLNNFRNQTNPENDLPTQSEVQTTGNPISDTYRDITNWFKGTTSTISKGMSYFGGLLAGPVPYVQAMNLPIEFTFVISSLWYGLTLFLIVAFTIGRTWI